MPVWEKFKKNIIDNNLVVSGDKILLAVSGGADSTVMADLFHRLKKILDIEFIIVNFNHNLRKESLKEAKFVESLAKLYNAKFILKNLPTKQFSKKEKISLETAGRRLRYSNLEQIAKENKCNKIATAHNMNDNAETVLMWLIRGTGTEGLSGIPQIRKINDKISVIRPMLAVSRDLIEQYSKHKNLKFCTDKSNFKCDYTRNKIRLNIIPQLKLLNPLVCDHIFNLSNIIATENGYFKNKTNSFILKHIKIQKGKITLNLSQFTSCDKLLQYKILKEILPDKKRSVQINNIIFWIKNGKTKQYVLSKFWIVTKSKKNRIIFKKAAN